MTPVLVYRGDGAYRPGLPPLDLDQDDLERVAARRGCTADELVAEAVGSGLYRLPADEPAQEHGGSK